MITITTACTTKPEIGNLTLEVIDGPVGDLRENWPCVAYTVALRDGDREIWRGSYRLGIGHVKPAGLQSPFTPWPRDMAEGEKRDLEHLSWQWAANPGLVYQERPNLLNQAKVAAILAKIQKVTPDVHDVLHSLLSDGSAWFDAQSFEDWAGDFGYDSDSRKAEAVYRECLETGRKLTSALGAERVAELRSVFQDY